MASAGHPRVSIQICQLGQARLRGRYTLVVSEYPGSGSDPPIGSDRKWVLQILCTLVLFPSYGLCIVIFYGLLVAG